MHDDADKTIQLVEESVTVDKERVHDLRHYRKHQKGPRGRAFIIAALTSVPPSGTLRNLLS
jgi:hypothetical protein